MFNFKIINKKNFKKYIKNCFFCSENDLSILDVHRILEGKNGGNYDSINVLVVCSNCHRKIHSNQIVIKKKHKAYNCKSNYLVECVINNQELWLNCDY
jgi:3-deoxy-D-arabino-heptulosonate 7-phosphate (DAHP) synthase